MHFNMSSAKRQPSCLGLSVLKCSRQDQCMRADTLSPCFTEAPFQYEDDLFMYRYNHYSWWFLSVSWYFTIIRHMSREPDFSTKNRIFKNFLKCLKACLVGVFWVFQSIFSIVRHLGREPDFWAENRIFKNFLKSLKTCLVGVFWVFQGILALFEICAENHIFEPRTEFSRISQKASKHVLLVFSGCFNVFF